VRGKSDYNNNNMGWGQQEGDWMNKWESSSPGQQTKGETFRKTGWRSRGGKSKGKQNGGGVQGSQMPTNGILKKNPKRGEKGPR